ncbi:MAG: DUF4249 domain-containing protein [Bacteroidota bacterium]
MNLSLVLPSVRALLAIWLCLCSGACVERIDFEVERTAGQLVVDGGFTNEEGIQRIRLGETVAVVRLPLPVEDAHVRLYEDSGEFEDYVHDPEEPGTYLLHGTKIQGKPGHSYFVEITLANGRVYRSKEEEMQPQQAMLDSIYYDFSLEKEISSAGVVIENTYINAYIDVELSQLDRTTFLRWDVEEVFLLTPTDEPDPFGFVPPPCYVYQYPSAIDLNLYDGSVNDIGRLEGLKVASQVLDWTFQEKHYFTVKQLGMNQEAFDYWDNVRDLLTNVGSIFDTPPAPLSGNVFNVNDSSEEVLGYFGVSSVSEIRFAVLRQDIPLDQVLECTYSQDKYYLDYPARCWDCLSVRNSTYTRPDFF